MYFDGKATCRYLRRRHKLYKAVNNYIHGTSPISVNQQETQQDCLYQLNEVRQCFTTVVSIFMEQSVDIFQTLDTLKLHNKILNRFNREFIESIVLATKLQSGHKLAYVIVLMRTQIVYRFCRDNPQLFKRVVIILQSILLRKNQKKFFGLELCIFYTDLFFYGFFFTAKTYLDRILCQCQAVIIDLIIRLPPVREWEIFISRRHLFKIRTCFQNWMNELIKNTKLKFQVNLSLPQKLQILADQIQSQIVHSKIKSRSNQVIVLVSEDNVELENSYTILFEQYQNTRSKLQYLEKHDGIRPSRNLQKVVIECEHYEPLFRLPELLHQLYKQREIPKIQIKKIKKSQMVTIFDDQAFLTQLKICSSIEKAVDLSAYFIANLSTEINIELLIEYIIDQCHHESNLDLVMKIVVQISCEYPEIGENLNKKAHKIASTYLLTSGQIRMNRKYLNLLCEGIKYGLIDSIIILEYVEKRILTEHTEMSVFEIIRESCNILELLGQSVYHESLKTNIFINKLFEMIDQKIKEKRISIEFAFNLKCVKNYLRRTNYLPEIIQNSAEMLENQTLSELTEEFTLQQHFDLILKRIKELLANKGNNKTEETYDKRRIVNYIVLSIQNKSNFLQVFYEASLVKEINHKEIKEEIIQKCTLKIQQSVESNIQQALKWSRFLGELYNYEILNRKKLAQILEGKLLFCAQLSNELNLQKMVKCIIECVNISKSYILQSEISKQTNHYIINFMIKLRRFVLKELSVRQGPNKGRFDNIMTEQEFEQMLAYFHPVLVNKLRSVEEIDLWTQKVKFSSPKDTLLSVNIYKVLQFYDQFDKVEIFDPTLMEGVNKKQTIPKESKVNTNGKKLIYKQKQAINISKAEIKQNMQPVKSQMSKIQEIDKQIEEINENFRNEEKEQVPEEQKELIRQEEYDLEKNLKEMMGITAQTEMNQKFPSINQTKFKASNPSESFDNPGASSFKKILKNPEGKKIKIITRRMNTQKFI